MFARNGEAPLPILAPRSPGDCFAIAIEAWRLAVECMTPVMILSDGYIANGSEPWKIPDLSQMPRIQISHPEGPRIQPRHSCLTLAMKISHDLGQSLALQA